MSKMSKLIIESTFLQQGHFIQVMHHMHWV